MDDKIVSNLINPEFPSLPFLTRDMLKFGRSSKLELEIQSYANFTSNITLQGMTREGTFIYNHTPSGDFSRKVEKFHISDIPIIVSVVSPTITVDPGRCWVVLRLIIDGIQIGELCSGRVHGARSLTWPGADHESPDPGKGWITWLTGADPAVTVAASIATPANTLTRIIDAKTKFDTDANVGNRFLRFALSDDGNFPVNVVSSTAITANQDLTISIISQPSVISDVQGTFYTMTIPPERWITGETSIFIASIGGQAGDDFDALEAHVEILPFI